MRNVDARDEMPGAVLWVGADDLEAITVDASGERAPKGRCYHTAEAINWRFAEPLFVENDSRSAVITSDGELLDEIGQHVVSLGGI